MARGYILLFLDLGGGGGLDLLLIFVHALVVVHVAVSYLAPGSFPRASLSSSWSSPKDFTREGAGEGLKGSSLRPLAREVREPSR